jgi:hypothetical protein
MSKRMRNKLPPGIISSRDYPIGQFGSGQAGGCPMGMYQSGPQAGGFAFLPAIAAAYAGLKAVQPFSKAKRALEENVGDKGKSSLGYKIAHKVASVGTSLGFGQTASIMGPKTFNSGRYQPILNPNKLKKQIGGSKRRQSGAGRKRKSKKNRK